MKASRWLASIGAALAALAGRGGERNVIAAPVPPTGLRETIDRLARPMVDGGVAVGFVIGVLHDGKSDFFAYGETARGSGVAPGPDTVYEIGSITKVFTGLLLAEAVQRGEVGLDDPLQKHLGAAATMPLRGEPITLAHLASHTSGLPRLPDNLKPRDPEDPYADYTVAQSYAFLGAHTLRRAPGEYEYSNYGGGLLGHVLSLPAGRTYEELVIERVLKPLGLGDTRITLTPDQRRRLVPGYDASLRPARNWEFTSLAGAGALRSTPRDMLAFAKASLDTSGPLARAFALSQRKRASVPGGLAVGLGWHIAADGSTLWHDGGTGGYRSWLAVLPDRKLAVVLLASTAAERLTALGEDVTRAAAGIDVPTRAVPTEIAVDPRVLETYAGSYALSPDFELTVTVEDGRLMVRATGQEKYPVFASAPGMFFYKVVDAQLTFVTGADGRVERVILHQGGRDTPGPRKR